MVTTGEATLLEDTDWPFYSVQCSIACLDKELISQSHDSRCYILVYQPMENNNVLVQKGFIFQLFTVTIRCQ